MIRRIKHRGLKRLYDDDDHRGLNAQHVERIRRILAYLDRATDPRDLDLPGWRFHPLRGDLAGFWSVTANWRVVLRFEDGGVTDVDYVDYH